MRVLTTTCAALFAAVFLGCNGPRPTPLENPWGLDAGLVGPGAAGTSSTDDQDGASLEGAAGQPGTDTPGAAGAPAPAIPALTCPNCAGLCVFGFCFDAPPTGGASGGAGTNAGSGGSGAQAACGNGRVGRGETCDPPSSCPDDCDDEDSCTVDDHTGSAESCDFECSHTAIEDCEDDDGCCPSDCNANDDSDCSPSCGNEELEEDETCDPKSSCPASCDDAMVCTSDIQVGSVANCNVVCSHAAITACGASEGCCPDGCGPTTDSDCPGCGNGRVEAGLDETCDPPASCATSCDDSDECTVDQKTGTSASCDVACHHTAITTCIDDDGCCAQGCGPTTDNDCPGCGNGKIEAGLDETCDPPSTCTCVDDEPCTTNVRHGTPSSCNVTCEFPAITTCSDTGDNCCPEACTADTDADCEP